MISFGATKKQTRNQVGFSKRIYDFKRNQVGAYFAGGGGYNWRKHLPEGHPQKTTSHEAWKALPDDERSARLRASRDTRREKHRARDAAILKAAGIDAVDASLGELTAAERGASTGVS